MKIAFYKGKTRFFNKFVSWWTSGPYSHCEAILNSGLCASSSFLDGGVRIKLISLDPEHWDIIDVPALDADKSEIWFRAHLGCKYDLSGLLSVVTPIKEDNNKYFCNESIGASVGINEPWRFTPNSFARLCEALGGKWFKI